MNKGFSRGNEKDTVALDKGAPLNFKLIKRGSHVEIPNPEA